MSPSIHLNHPVVRVLQALITVSVVLARRGDARALQAGTLMHPPYRILDVKCTLHLRFDSYDYCRNFKKYYTNLELIYSCSRLDVFYQEVIKAVIVLVAM